MGCLIEIIGHGIFLAVHVAAVLFTCGGALLLTIPMHLIFVAAMMRRR